MDTSCNTYELIVYTIITYWRFFVNAGRSIIKAEKGGNRDVKEVNRFLFQSG